MDCWGDEALTKLSHILCSCLLQILAIHRCRLVWNLKLEVISKPESSHLFLSKPQSSHLFLSKPKFTMAAPLKTLRCFAALFLLLVIIFPARVVYSGTIIKTLPGYSGDLPFTLETGYIGLGEEDEVQLFYYFVESQRSPTTDPIIIWFTGGPGCSCLSAFFYESGPIIFDQKMYNVSVPSLIDNENAWTKTLNIIYVDSPVGTGFSYSTTQAGYQTNDYKASSQAYQFLRKFMIDHPTFLMNQLYVGGDSYSGIVVPMIVEEIVNGNEAGLLPMLNLKGYVLGNPKTDDFLDVNCRVPFSHRLTLIDDALYESAKTSCNGDYVNVNSSNADCLLDLAAIDELIREINLMQVLEPTCVAASPKSKDKQRSLLERPRSYLMTPVESSTLWCRYYNYVVLGVWANSVSVRQALNVRNGTTGTWERCNGSLAYTKLVTSSVPYHQRLSANSSLRALVYSGDHDLSVPHIGTQNWISSLNMTLYSVWRAWFVDGQVAGYTQKFILNNFSLNYATIKGAGHVAPEYKPKECYAMIDRWFAYYPF